MGRGCQQSNGALAAFGSAAIKLRVELEPFIGARRKGSEMLVVGGGVWCGDTHHEGE